MVRILVLGYCSVSHSDSAIRNVFVVESDDSQRLCVYPKDMESALLVLVRILMHTETQSCEISRNVWSKHQRDVQREPKVRIAWSILFAARVIATVSSPC